MLKTVYSKYDNHSCFALYELFGGTFVPLSVLNSTVRKVARFVPVFWYEDINDTLSSYAKLLKRW